MNTDALPGAVRRLLARRRGRRTRFILSKVNTFDGMRVIDIGCGKDGRSFSDHAPASWQITGVDILPHERVSHSHPNFTFVRQSAKDLSEFEDGEFDLAVSIGLFEHFTAPGSFEQAAAEIQRVARQYVLVVPYRYAWIEPHYGVPLFPVLPYRVKVALVEAFDLSGHREAVRRNQDHIRIKNRWRSNAEYRRAFPEARIYFTPTFETIAVVKRDDSSAESG